MVLKKHSETSIEDAKAVTTVKLKLLEGKIPCDFKDNDKWPSVDGRFELRNPKTAEPEKSFCVQIKGKENLSRLADGTISYQLDTAVLEYVKERITADPTIVFIVETSTGKIFWRHLTDTYLMSLNFEGKGSVALHFNENDQLINIEDFAKRMRGIVTSVNKILTYKTPEQIAEIQLALKWLNSNLDKMEKVKNRLFPNLWCFKLGHSKSSISIRTMGSGHVDKNDAADAFELMPQFRGENSSGIEEFTGAGMNLNWDLTNTTKPMDYVKEAMEKYLDQYFNNCVPDMRYMPEIILHEVLYSFLDELAFNFPKYASVERYRAYSKDEEQLDFIEDILFKFFAYFQNILTKTNHEGQEGIILRVAEGASRMSGEGLDIVDIIGTFLCEPYFEKFVKDVGFKPHIGALRFSKREYLLYIAAIMELKNRKISTVKRVWNYNRIEGKIDYPERTLLSLYSKNDLEESIHKSFSDIAELYEEYFDKVFDTNEFKKSLDVKYRIDYEDRLLGYGIDSMRVQSPVKNRVKIVHDPDLDVCSGIEDENFCISRSIFDIELIYSKMPLFILLQMLTYQGICDKLGIKCKGIGRGILGIDFF